MSVLQRLYDSEINASISTFWDGGFEVKIGDDMNGFMAEANVRDYAEAEVWLEAEAKRLFPTSVFATGVYPEGYTGIGSGTGADGSALL